MDLRAGVNDSLTGVQQQGEVTLSCRDRSVQCALCRASPRPGVHVDPVSTTRARQDAVVSMYYCSTL